MSVRPIRAASFLLLLLPLLLAAGCRPASDVDVFRPDAFARQAVLQPAAGGTLQRVNLPGALVVAAQRRDLGDIRLFDAEGQRVPLALLAPDALSGPQRSVDVPIYSVLGEDEALQDAQLTIRVEDGGATQAVTVDRGVPTAGRTRMPAVLLDTRTLREPVDAIALRADIPPGRPVALTLLTSANLKDWTPLAEKVLFRPAGGGPLLDGAQVPLNGADLQGRFVGVSWTGTEAVAVTGARAVTAPSADARRTAVPAAPLSLTDPYTVQFTLPDNSRLAALRLMPSPVDGIVPVRLHGRLYGRDDWSLLAAVTLSADGRPSTIPLPAARFASYRLEADRRTAGFTAAPAVELLFDPVDLLVALRGTPPYRLAIGQPAAPPSYLSLREIAPGDTPLDLAKLPRATLALADMRTPHVALQGPPADVAGDRRKAVLWLALLFGTLVLAFAAFRLLRGSRPSGAAA